jgi:hypothetical protein
MLDTLPEGVCSQLVSFLDTRSWFQLSLGSQAMLSDLWDNSSLWCLALNDLNATHCQELVSCTELRDLYRHATYGIVGSQSLWRLPEVETKKRMESVARACRGLHVCDDPFLVQDLAAVGVELLRNYSVSNSDFRQAAKLLLQAVEEAAEVLGEDAVSEMSAAYEQAEALGESLHHVETELVQPGLPRECWEDHYGINRREQPDCKPQLELWRTLRSLTMVA